MATVLQLSNPRVLAWLASLRQPPVHHGLLGLNENGRVVMRYCVLFQDHLDSWEQPLLASSGQKPRGRIALCGIRNIAIVRGGFIISRRGHTINLVTAGSEDVGAWSAALQSIVRTNRSPSPRCFVPRVASLTPSRQQRTTVLYPHAAFTRVSPRDGIFINTHKNANHASTLIHGSTVNFLPRSESSPSLSGHRLVTSCPSRCPLSDKKRPLSTEHVTGRQCHTPRVDRDRSPIASKITGNRVLSPKGEGHVAPKITGRRDVSRDRPRHRSITEKITNREPLILSKPVSAASLGT